MTRQYFWLSLAVSAQVYHTFTDVHCNLLGQHGSLGTVTSSQGSAVMLQKSQLRAPGLGCVPAKGCSPPSSSQHGSHAVPHCSPAPSQGSADRKETQRQPMDPAR